VPVAVAVAVADWAVARPEAVAVVVRVPLLVRADQVNVGIVYLDLFAVAAEVAVAVEEGPEQRPPVQVEEAPAILGLQQAVLEPAPAVVVEPVGPVERMAQEVEQAPMEVAAVVLPDLPKGATAADRAFRTSAEQ
jgi:hypothetical protein